MAAEPLSPQEIERLRTWPIPYALPISSSVASVVATIDVLRSERDSARKIEAALMAVDAVKLTPTECQSALILLQAMASNSGEVRQ